MLQQCTWGSTPGINAICEESDSHIGQALYHQLPTISPAHTMAIIHIHMYFYESIFYFCVFEIH